MSKINLVGLIVLDGWGIREMKHGNAIVSAQTPNYCDWLRTVERSILDASGEAVGLTEGQMGNSEVGHLNLGAGFVVYQDITRIDQSIKDGRFFQIPALVETIEKAKSNNRDLHLIGLLGPGGVHSHQNHLFALLQLAKQHGVKSVVHVITDGRDTPPRSGEGFVQNLESFLAKFDVGKIASVSGRYYAMDRDKRWERTKLAYNAIAFHKGNSASSATRAVVDSYAKGIGDEFIIPTVIDQNGSEFHVEKGDSIIFYNFRADRMRQIVKAFLGLVPPEANFPEPISGLEIVTLTQYEKELPVQVIFPPESVSNPLARVISAHGLTQFHAAETEKYAHVTYFFNGGREEPFKGEDRLLVPSPKVATYDLKPEMSAPELTRRVIERIRSVDYSFVLVNYANADMVGHSGIVEAGIKAVETVDLCLGELVAEIRKKRGVALVTADHGNAERMIDEYTGGPHTYHTTSPVPLLAIGDSYIGLRPRGILADVAPTILDLLGLPKPDEMTGTSLICREEASSQSSDNAK